MNRSKMKRTLAPVLDGVVADSITWLEAPPPEMEVIDAVEIAARWVMEGGKWVKQRAVSRKSRRFQPRSKT